MEMGRSSNPMFSDQLSPSIPPELESLFNLPYLPAEDDNIDPSFDALPAITSLPFDLLQDLNVAEVVDEILGTPSSTTSEGLGYQFCDICFKPLKPSDTRYVSQQNLLLISTKERC